MAKESKPKDESSTNVAVNKEQHGFSGETVKVKFFKAEVNEPVQIFVQVNSYKAMYQRQKELTIPVEVADHLELLTYGILEPDEAFPDDRSKDQWVEKQRFPFQRL